MAGRHEVVGVLPASGRATRLGGLPKFALPCDDANTPLISRHVAQMLQACDRVVVSTTRHWAPLMELFALPVELLEIEPSTMNDAVLRMQEHAQAPYYAIGMADTYFLGENPYPSMVERLGANDLVVSAWPVRPELKGRVGQVLVVDGEVRDSVDKSSYCDYPLMWGALGMSAQLAGTIDPANAHPGIDLPRILEDSTLTQSAVLVEGDYFDVGTFLGYKTLLDRIQDS